MGKPYFRSYLVSEIVAQGAGVGVWNSLIKPAAKCGCEDINNTTKILGIIWRWVFCGK